MAINKKKVSETPKVGNLEDFIVLGLDKNTNQNAHADMAQLRGNKGDKGDKGDKGNTGAQGPKGEKGDTGPQGVQGPIGLQGLKGDKGDRGAQGIQGERGMQGEKGDPGQGLNVVGQFDTPEELKTAFPEGTPGSFQVGTEAPYLYYFWDTHKEDWVCQGTIQGPPGRDGVDGENGLMPVTAYDFRNGYLVKTKITKMSNTFASIQVTGSGLRGNRKFSILELYNYGSGNRLMAPCLLNVGIALGEVSFFYHEGVVCFWIPPQTANDSLGISGFSTSPEGKMSLLIIESITDALIPEEAEGIIPAESLDVLNKATRFNGDVTGTFDNLKLKEVTLDDVLKNGNTSNKEINAGNKEGVNTLEGETILDSVVSTPSGIPMPVSLDVKRDIFTSTLIKGAFPERLAFYPIENVLIRKSEDGETWENLNVNNTIKKKLVGGDFPANINFGTSKYAEIEFINAREYVYLNLLAIQAYMGINSHTKIEIYGKLYGSDRWSLINGSDAAQNKQIKANHSWTYIHHRHLPFSTNPTDWNYSNVKIRFIHELNGTNESLVIGRIKWFGSYPAATNKYNSNGFFVYENMDAEFPAAVSSPAVPTRENHLVNKNYLDAVLAYESGYSEVTTLDGLPVGKRSVLARLSSGTTLSYRNNTLPQGKEQHIKAYNTGSAEITVILPNDALWESKDTSGNAIGSITIAPGGSTEINIWSLHKYIVKTDA